ncbi:MAG: signal peptidase I [Bacilli bacterium]|nr:signal peptidase I [Bacilli bacterium]MDD4608264.1 signal peptidase I [Bacilli bacterium]
MKNKLKKVFSTVQTVIIIVLSIFVVSTLIQKLFPNNPSIFGFRTYSISSNSMKPDLSIGNIILVKEIDPHKIKIGDIITYEGMNGELIGKRITHKVEGISQEKDRVVFYTKGTNNTTTDPVVYENQVYGKMIYKFKFFSLVSMIMRNTYGFILLVVIPLGMIYISEVKDLIKEIKARKNN